MEESELQVFIKGVTRYFTQVCGEAPIIDPPFLKGEERIILKYTGVIGISGKRKGAVYYTTDEAVLADILKHLGEEEIDDELLSGMVGELANTISGNAREEFGGEFMISVPVVIQGSPDEIRFPKDKSVFVIPIVWKENRSFLIICLE